MQHSKQLSLTDSLSKTEPLTETTGVLTQQYPFIIHVVLNINIKTDQKSLISFL